MEIANVPDWLESHTVRGFRNVGVVAVRPANGVGEDGTRRQAFVERAGTADDDISFQLPLRSGHQATQNRRWIGTASVRYATAEW